MTPQAHVAAAIDILDTILAGTAAEAALTKWGRGNRFAGSKDRAKIRDIVFSCVRNLNSFQSVAARSSSNFSGRDILVGYVHASGQDPDKVFTGEGYAAAPLTSDEKDAVRDDGADCWNLPDWLVEEFRLSLGPDAGFQQAQSLTHRAPVTVRANIAKCTREELANTLEEAGFPTQVNPLAKTALTIANARGLSNTEAFRNGLFELQDASSQAVTASLDLERSTSLLDFCAGGGGKALSLAPRMDGPVFVHDANPSRMKDLPNRAARAGVTCSVVKDLSELDGRQFDVVLADAPCSGSGAWRRSPDAKWRLTRETLDDLVALQAEVLLSAAGFVRPGGVLAYATCSVLSCENQTQVEGFLASKDGWELSGLQSWPVCDDGDGFFLAQLKRKSVA